MDPQMFERVLALIEFNLFTTGLVGLVYGLIFVLIFREIRKGHQSLAALAGSLERIEASAERIAQMVRELHNR